MSLQQQRIDYSGVLAQFDTAVGSSQISWAPTAPIHLTDHGYQLQFRVCFQILHKPQLPDLEPKDDTASDIFSADSLHIASIPPSHRLVLNAYPVIRPSFLLLTASPAYRQSAALDFSDISAAWAAMSRLEGDGGTRKYMMIYNCGREAGCSRSHKHMQLFPRPLDFVLFPDREPSQVIVPFAYDLVRLEPFSLKEDFVSHLYSSYLSCLGSARTILGVAEGEHVPHNVVLVREWLLVIPRKKARVGGISANAAGMVGLVWTGAEEELDEWKRKGPSSVLREMGAAVEDCSGKSMLEPSVNHAKHSDQQT